MVRQWLLSAFGPSSRFVEGDTVQPVAGERELMVVKKVVLNRKSTEPQILCRWTDSHTDEFREHWFAEHEVEPFNWNRPMVPTPKTSGELTNVERPVSLKEVHHWETLFGIDATAGLSRLNNNEVVYEKLLLKFHDTHLHFSGDLADKIANGEWTDARRMAHTIKGLAGTLGMHQLEGVARELEEQLSRQSTDCSQQLSRLSSELEVVLKSIGGTIQTEKAGTPYRSPVNIVSSLKELELSLLDHNPQAIDQWDQIGTIRGHEQEGQTLGKAIVTYEFETALTLLRAIQNQVGDPGENNAEES